MTRPSTLRGAPGLLLVSLFLAALAACGPASRDAGVACTADPECGPGARCVQGACQASRPPQAEFTLPASLTTHRAVSVTATAFDPDPGDSVAAWAWTITPLSGGCAADADVPDAATLEAVFWCAGTYEVALVVTDAAGAQAAPVRRTVTVTAQANPPSVTAGPPVAVDHRCEGQPLRCGLVLPVGLSADAQAPLGVPLTFRWSAIPPDASRAAAQVELLPSASSQAPTLAITSDGGAMAGAWRLRVRVSDAAGNLAQAHQLVTVSNRPPLLDGAPLGLDHAYAGGRYVAEGILAVPVSDPDGDPIELSLALEEPAESGCTAELVGAALALACPTPAGLQAAGRALVVSTVDANGAAASAVVALQVRNRLPVVRTSTPGLLEVERDHGVGPCPGGGACFLVSGPNPFVAEDPDGDPVTAVTLVAGVDAARPASFGEALPGPDGGSFLFGTPVGYPVEFRSQTGASGFWLTATASDPFGASAPGPSLAVRIRNRPPQLASAPAPMEALHRYDIVAGAYQAAAPLAAFEDPDGDPLAAGGTGDESCADFSVLDGVVWVTCARPFPATGGYPTLAGFAGPHTVVAIATDGWSDLSVPGALTVGNQPPTVPAYTGAVEACTCRCARWDPEPPRACAVEPRWASDSSQATFPVRPADADGDPLRVTFTLAPGAPSGATVSPASFTSPPSAAGATLSTTAFPVSVLVTVNDGVSQATATWTATQVTCAKAGQVCVL